METQILLAFDIRTSLGTTRLIRRNEVEGAHGGRGLRKH